MGSHLIFSFPTTYKSVQTAVLKNLNNDLKEELQSPVIRLCGSVSVLLHTSSHVTQWDWIKVRPGLCSSTSF